MIPRSAWGMKQHGNYPSLTWASLPGKWKLWEWRPIRRSLLDPWVSRIEGVPMFSCPMVPATRAWRPPGPAAPTHAPRWGSGPSSHLQMLLSWSTQENIKHTKDYLLFLFLPQNIPFQMGDRVVFVLLLSRADKIFKYFSKIKEERVFPECEALQLTMNIHCQREDFWNNNVENLRSWIVLTQFQPSPWKSSK